MSDRMADHHLMSSLRCQHIRPAKLQLSQLVLQSLLSVSITALSYGCRTLMDPLEHTLWVIWIYRINNISKLFDYHFVVGIMLIREFIKA